MAPTADVAVLLAAYNGEAYLQQQIESIFAGTLVPDCVVIRDDASTDNTLKLARQLASRFPQIRVLSASQQEKHGHLANFSALVEYALTSLPHAYFAFSDQDDVWYPDKLAVLLSSIQGFESGAADNKPILVHSDLQVVDQDLACIAPSFVRFQGLPDPASQPFQLLLHQNVVTGCTCLFNRALLKVAGPIPDHALVHDFWFGLCAMYMGTLDYIAQPLVDYRQHGANAIGAKEKAARVNYFSWGFVRQLVSFCRHFVQSLNQARALLQRQHDLQLPAQPALSLMLAEYSNLTTLSWIARLRACFKFFPGKRSMLERGFLLMVFWLLPVLRQKS